jgi:hypothetical protein
MITGELLNASLPKEIDAAVPHICERKVISLNQYRDNRRTHAGTGEVLGSFLVDGLIRYLNGVTQRVCPVRDSFESSNYNLLIAFLLILAKISQKRVDRYLAGAFASRLPTHSVTQQEDTAAGIEAKVVLIVRPYDPDIGLTGNLQNGNHSDLRGVVLNLLT